LLVSNQELIPRSLLLRREGEIKPLYLFLHLSSKERGLRVEVLAGEQSGTHPPTPSLEKRRGDQTTIFVPAPFFKGERIKG
jgi:hypothetical protein